MQEILKILLLQQLLQHTNNANITKYSEYVLVKPFNAHFNAHFFIIV